MWSRARHEEKKADILKYDTSCFSTIESHFYIRFIFSTSLFVHAMPTIRDIHVRLRMPLLMYLMTPSTIHLKSNLPMQSIDDQHCWSQTHIAFCQQRLYPGQTILCTAQLTNYRPADMYQTDTVCTSHRMSMCQL